MRAPGGQGGRHRRNWRWSTAPASSSTSAPASDLRQVDLAARPHRVRCPGGEVELQPGVAAPLANVPKDYEARLVKMDFTVAAANRERILEEWTKRYNAKSEPKK